MRRERSSIPEVGRLLHVLVAQRGRTRVGELGAGCGTGAAWIVSALPPGVPFVTVELDETGRGPRPAVHRRRKRARVQGDGMS